MIIYLLRNIDRLHKFKQSGFALPFLAKIETETTDNVIKVRDFRRVLVLLKKYNIKNLYLYGSEKNVKDHLLKLARYMNFNLVYIPQGQGSSFNGVCYMSKFLLSFDVVTL